MGLGGTVVMVGTREADAEITAEAGMWAISWSMLGLVGSSAVKYRSRYYAFQKSRSFYHYIHN